MTDKAHPVTSILQGLGMPRKPAADDGNRGGAASVLPQLGKVQLTTRGGTSAQQSSGEAASSPPATYGQVSYAKMLAQDAQRMPFKSMI